MRRFWIATVGPLLGVGAACADLGNLSGGGAEADASADGQVVRDGATDAGDGTVSSSSTFIVVIGGLAPNAMASSDVYVTQVADDGSLGTWAKAAPLPAPRFITASVTIGPRIVATGGDRPNMLPSSTPLVGTFVGGTVSSWAEGAPLPVNASNGLTRHGSVAHDGHVYTVGGDTGAIAADVLFTRLSASGALGTWTPTTALPQPRMSAVTVATDAHVYVLSGKFPADGGGEIVTGDAVVNDFLADGSLAAWRSITPLPVTTFGAAGAASATTVYASGGYASSNNRFVVRAGIQADGSIGSWVPAPSLQTGREGHGMVLARGHLFAIGGMDIGGNPLSSVEVADLDATGAPSSFRSATPLPIALTFVSATVVEVP